MCLCIDDIKSCSKVTGRRLAVKDEYCSRPEATGEELVVSVQEMEITAGTIVD